VTFERAREHPGDTPGLPTSIWMVAWASLAGQSVLLIQLGSRRDDAWSIFLSVVLGALVVGYVSAGVVRARTVRLMIAWIVLVLDLFGGLAELARVDDAGQAALAVVSLTATLVALAGLATFRHTAWYAWQRTQPSPREGAPIGGLVAVAVIVGVLAGLAGPVERGLNVNVDVAGR
jgi:hypothetical protein